jgi:hypothetical protein
MGITWATCVSGISCSGPCSRRMSVVLGGASLPGLTMVQKDPSGRSKTDRLAVLCESVEGRGRHARTVARPKLAALATSSRGSSAIDRSGTGMYGISASTFDSRTHTRRKPGSQSHGSSPPPRRRPPSQPLTPEESTTAEPPQNRRSIRDSGPCLLRMVPCQGAGVKRRLERASVVEANQTQ